MPKGLERLSAAVRRMTPRRFWSIAASLAVAGVFLAGVAAAAYPSSWSVTQNAPAQPTPHLLAVCANLTGTYGAPGDWVSFDCANGTPALGVITSGNYTATFSGLNTSGATDFYVFPVPTNAIILPGAPVPLSCAQLAGAEFVANASSPSGVAHLVSTIPTANVLGYDYCVDAPLSAGAIGPFVVTWGAAGG